MTTVLAEAQPSHLLNPGMEAHGRSEWVYEQIAVRLGEFYQSERYARLQRLGVERVRLQAAGSMHGHRIFEGDQTIHPDNSSYKIHGVANAALVNSERATAAGQVVNQLVVLSTGNHGEAAAAVGAKLATEVLVMMPKGASEKKQECITRHGAKVVTDFTSLSEAQPIAEAMGRTDGTVNIHPYNDLDVLTGQAIMGTQLVEDLLAEGVRGRVVVHAPVGGGGFITGLVMGSRYAMDLAAADGVTPPFELEFVGVQMHRGDPARRAVANYRAGRPHDTMEELFGTTRPDKTCDATFAVPGDFTLPVLADPTKVSDIQLVTKAQVGQAMIRLSKRLGKMVEPAGTLSRASAEAWAARHATSPLSGEGVTLVTYVTGSNVTPECYREFTELGEQERQAAVRRNEESQAAELADYRKKIQELARPAVRRATTGSTTNNIGKSLLAGLSPTGKWRRGLVEPTPRPTSSS